MALQAVTGGFPFPVWPAGHFGAPGNGTTFLMDASSEKAALVFAATAAKSIRKIHFRTGTVTTGATIDARVETVDTAANGDPTGTLWATNTNGAVVVADGDDDVWKTATLTADASVSVGDVCALVIANAGSGNMTVLNYTDTETFFPYGDHFTAAWAKTTVTPLIVPEYSDGSFEPIFGFFDEGRPINTQTFNSGSTTNRRGNIFQLAFPARAKGCWAWIDADGDFTVKLYDSDGSTVLATTATLNRFQRQGGGGSLQFYPFTATATLAKATNYRIAVVPGTVTNLSTYDFEVVSAGMLDMFPGGQSCHRSVYTSSAWVETTTARSYLGVILDAFDDAVSSGGINAPRFMTGGLT